MLNNDPSFRDSSPLNIRKLSRQESINVTSEHVKKEVETNQDQQQQQVVPKTVKTARQRWQWAVKKINKKESPMVSLFSGPGWICSNEAGSIIKV